MPSLLDMVKVLSFALQEGKVSLKMAVSIINKWCHYILSKVVLLSCLAAVLLNKVLADEAIDTSLEYLCVRFTLRNKILITQRSYIWY